MAVRFAVRAAETAPERTLTSRHHEDSRNIDCLRERTEQNALRRVDLRQLRVHLCTLARQRPASGPPCQGRVASIRGVASAAAQTLRCQRWELVSIACCAIALADCVTRAANMLS